MALLVGTRQECKAVRRALRSRVKASELPVTFSSRLRSLSLEIALFGLVLVAAVSYSIVERQYLVLAAIVLSLWYVFRHYHRRIVQTRSGREVTITSRSIRVADGSTVVFESDWPYIRLEAVHFTAVGSKRAVEGLTLSNGRAKVELWSLGLWSPPMWGTILHSLLESGTLKLRR